MSIFYICGKPGGGKSYCGVQQIVHELMDPASNRFIVTNIALNFGDRVEDVTASLPFAWRVFGRFLRLLGKTPPEQVTVKKVHKGLATFLHERCKHEVNLRERVRILDDQEAGEFWLYEPGRKFEKRKTLTIGKHEKDVPDFEDRAVRGCLYVIDECHNYFPAREWQLTGQDATFFLSQHRKLQCDVILITQHPEQCDKALRRLAQEYMSVRNLGREPVMGFRLGSLFRYTRTLNSPQSANPAAFESGFIPLKPEELGALYDTMAGVGIAGRVTPKQEKRGRSIWWISVPVALFIVGFIYLFTHMSQVNEFINSAFRKVFNQTSGKIAADLHLPVAATNAPLKSPAENLEPAVVPAPVASVQWNGGEVMAANAQGLTRATGGEFGDTNQVWCSGYVILNGQPVVFLSDGSTAYGEDGEVQIIKRHSVMCFGRWFRVKTQVPVAMVQPAFSFGPPVTTIPPSAPALHGSVEVGPTINGIQLEPPTPLHGFDLMQSAGRAN